MRLISCPQISAIEPHLTIKFCLENCLVKIKDFLHFNHGLFFKRRKEFSQLTKGQSFRADVRVGLAPAKKKKKEEEGFVDFWKGCGPNKKWFTKKQEIKNLKMMTSSNLGHLPRLYRREKTCCSISRVNIWKLGRTTTGPNGPRPKAPPLPACDWPIPPSWGNEVKQVNVQNRFNYLIKITASKTFMPWDVLNPFEVTIYNFLSNVPNT